MRLHYPAGGSEDNGGACDIAPAVRINHDVYGGLTREKVRELVASYRAKEAVK